MWLIEQLYTELGLGQRTAIAWLVTTIMQYAAKSFISIDYGYRMGSKLPILIMGKQTFL